MTNKIDAVKKELHSSVQDHREAHFEMTWIDIELAIDWMGGAD